MVDESLAVNNASLLAGFHCVRILFPVGLGCALAEATTHAMAWLADLTSLLSGKSELGALG